MSDSCVQSESSISSPESNIGIWDCGSVRLLSCAMALKGGVPPKKKNVAIPRSLGSSWLRNLIGRNFETSLGSNSRASRLAGGVFWSCINVGTARWNACAKLNWKACSMGRLRWSPTYTLAVPSTMEMLALSQCSAAHCLPLTNVHGGKNLGACRNKISDAEKLHT